MHGNSCEMDSGTIIVLMRERPECAAPRPIRVRRSQALQRHRWRRWAERHSVGRTSRRSRKTVLDRAPIFERAACVRKRRTRTAGELQAGSVDRFRARESVARRLEIEVDERRGQESLIGRSPALIGRPWKETGPGWRHERRRIAQCRDPLDETEGDGRDRRRRIPEHIGP